MEFYYECVFVRLEHKVASFAGETSKTITTQINEATNGDLLTK